MAIKSALYSLISGIFLLVTGTALAGYDSTNIQRFNVVPNHQGYVLTRGMGEKICYDGCYTYLPYGLVCLPTHRPEVLVAPLSSIYKKEFPIRRYVIENPTVEKSAQGNYYLLHFDKIYADEYGGDDLRITFNYTVFCV
jgi:hypothetical protein